MRVGINGIGRIGSHVLKILSKNKNFQVTTINDINSDIRNIAYILKYDSLYGRFDGDIEILSDNKILLNGQE